MNASFRVGFVGLGNLGAPMAHMIAHSGWPLTLYARRPEQISLYSGTAAAAVPSLKDLGAQSDLVCVMVGHDKDVTDVVVESGLLAFMRPGSTIAVHSTVHPSTCRGLAELGRKTNVSVIDAPVSGGGALQTLVSNLGLPLNAPPVAAPGRSVAPGKLAVMVGAEPHIFSRCRPVFESFGDPICLMGSVGAGQTTKLVNNLLAYANIAAAAAAFEVGGELGLDLDSLTEIVTAGSASSFAARSYAPYFRMGIHPEARSLIRKDIDLAADIIENAGLKSEILIATALNVLELMARQHAEP